MSTLGLEAGNARTPMGAQGVKNCSRCGVEKPLHDFQRRSSAKDGRRADCRACVRLSSADYYARNNETVKVKTAAHYHRNKDKERFVAKKKAYYLNNKAAAFKAARDHKSRNPEISRVAVRNRRAKAKGAGGRHTAAETSALLISQSYLCANPFCRIDLRIAPKHLDHWIPIARGGGNGIDNLKWLCQPCNHRKGSRLPHAWLEQERLRS